LRLDLHKIYKVSDVSRLFYVKVIDELCNWEYDYNTYRCEIISPEDYYSQVIILVTEMWNVREVSSLELELL
jgi:hypothetical protein